MKTHQAATTMIGLVLSVLLCSIPSPAQLAIWEPVRGPYGGGVTSMVADREGNLFAGTSRGVFRSTDGGTTWASCAPFTPSPGTFIIDSSGAILGWSTGLWRSTDAGATWDKSENLQQNIRSLVVTPDSNVLAASYGPTMPGVYRVERGLDWISQTGGTTNTLKDVCFLDARTCIAVGLAGTILGTTDRGTTWTSKPSGTTMDLRQVCFKNPRTGFVVGDSGTILRTTDGGTHWTAQTSGTSALLSAVSFADTLHGTVVGQSGTILRTTDGGFTWISQTSVATNWLLGVSFSDSNTGTIVGQGNVYLQGIILRTTDGGAVWTEQSSSSTPPLSVVCFVNADTGMAVGGNQIFRTTDGGANWISQSTGVTTIINGLRFTDANTGVAVGDEGTVLRTTDGGAQWVRQTKATNEILNGVALVDWNTCVAVGDNGATVCSRLGYTGALSSRGLSGKTVNSLLFSKKHGLLAIADWSSVYRGSITDTNWVKIGSIVQGGGPSSFVEDASGNLFCGPEIKGVYRSTDGGVTWNHTGLIPGQTVSSFAPLTNGKIYAGVSAIDPTIDSGVYVSSDGGLTWDSLGLKDWGISSVLALDSSHIFLGAGRGVIRSSNGGRNWEVASSGLVAGNTRTLLAVDSTTILAGMDFGLFRSSDNGASWQESSEGILPHTIQSLAADSSGSLFAGNMVFGPLGGIFKSTNAGRTWRCTSSDSLTSYYTPIQTIVVSRLNTILVGVGSRKWWISRSTDRGESWQPVPRITEAYSPVALTLDRAGNIYGATWGRGVLRSTDDGLTWSYTNTGLSDLNVYCVAARDSGEAYVGGTGGAFRSTNAGNSWVNITSSLGSIFVTAIAFDISGDLVISTSTGDVYRTTNGGVNRTTNGGVNWTKDTFAGSNHMIHSLTIRGGNLFAADSAGIFRCSRSATSVQQLSALLPASPGLAQNYPNPFNPSTTITFELPTSSVVRLSVYDILGREVSVLVNERRNAGVHEVKFDGAGLSSGVYFYRMQAGDVVQTKKLVLLR